MVATAALIALATLAVGLALAYILRFLPTVRLQLAGLAFLAVLLPLGAVLLSGWVMFHMGEDVKILAVIVASALTAVVAALVVARSIVAAIERVRDASVDMAHGVLEARAPEGGPTEVAELAASFNDMGDELRRLFDTRRELVAWASHDLRTPLANMQAMLEAVEDGLGSPDEYVPVLREQVHTLSLLVDDLFELARIDAGALTLELHRLPVAPVISSSLRSMEAEARTRHVRLAAEVDEDITARFAPEKLERVLMNLLTNALRHTPTDGSVAVRVEPRRDEVRVAVEDTGEGIDAEARERMFERFWRGDASRSSRGAGLGLAIARGLVEAHGGRIWAEDREGGGARGCVKLPARGGRPGAAPRRSARRACRSRPRRRASRARPGRRIRRRPGRPCRSNPPSPLPERGSPSTAVRPRGSHRRRARGCGATGRSASRRRAARACTPRSG
jgi:signal transduction histidine kinase